MKEELFDKKYSDITSLSKALSHPARIMILETLLQEEECVGDLVKRLPLAQATISQHLKELNKIGLLCVKVEGKKNYYCVDIEKFNELFKNFTSRIEMVLKIENT
ncbi:metalloregulator ArsR/SmtB family transcription factor [Francisella sp. 19X1-34]|uniref:ArsR/SmtB family transcription factor n=1 Tax=Francisella sp. 19X1-34 TaxID=3087177 RepID=UPI002E35DFF1|nr:metalloregulator ArsR/SmtB family transcription factor [Francisella sp. 19X1-34]MED7788194.1 metalloregulator ArsR/SmtB family transcription factor [Francisella sp. 19X1-34]